MIEIILKYGQNRNASIESMKPKFLDHWFSANQTLKNSYVNHNDWRRIQIVAYSKFSAEIDYRSEKREWAIVTLYIQEFLRFTHLELIMENRQSWNAKGSAISLIWMITVSVTCVCTVYSGKRLPYLFAYFILPFIYFLGKFSLL